MENNYAPVVQAKTIAAEQFLLSVKSHAPLTSAADAEESSSFLKQVKTKAAEIESMRVRFVKPLNDHVKTINNEFKKPLDLLAQAETAIKKLLLDWQQAENKRIAAEQERLRLEAAERERKERERLEKQAAKAEEKGKTEKAESLREQAEAVNIPAPIIAPAAKPTGFTTQVRWSAEVVDIRELARAVADSKQPTVYLEANMAALNKQATSLKSEMNIPGVKAVSKEIPVSR